MILWYGVVMTATEDTVFLSCRIPAKLMRRIDAYGRKYSVNRTSAVILLLGQGLESAQLPGRAQQPAIDGTVPREK